jgi:hypothetical protein
MADERANAYWEEEGDRRVLVVRGSGLGGCVKGLAREAAGYEAADFPGMLKVAMAEGVAGEPMVVKELLGRGWDLDWIGDGRQLEVDWKVGPKAKVRFHPDGIVRGAPGYKSGVYGLEVKCLREGGGMAGSEMYAWQKAVQVHGLGSVFQDFRGVLFVVATKVGDGRGDDVEFDRFTDGSLKLDVELITGSDVYSVGDVRGRVGEIMAAALQIEKGEGAGECEKRVWPCGMWELEEGNACGGRGKGAEGSGAEERERERETVSLGGLGRAWGMAREVLDLARGDEEAAKKAIKDIMEDRGEGVYRSEEVYRVNGEEVQLEVSWVKGRRGLDVAAAKKRWVELGGEVEEWEGLYKEGKGYWKLGMVKGEGREESRESGEGRGPGPGDWI